MTDTHFVQSAPLSLPGRKFGSTSTAFSVLTVVFSAGFIPNDISYVFIPFLVGISIALPRAAMTQSRLALIILTLLLCFYGGFLGLLQGHNVVYILKFFVPIFAFAVFLSLRNVGETLYTHRRLILILCFWLTVLFTLMIKFWISGALAVLMQAWTKDSYTRTAVSVFHYFALAFCLVQIFEFTCIRSSVAGLIRTLAAITTIGLLIYLTATSAFDLAAGVGILAIFARFVRVAIMIRLLFGIILVLLVDYFSVQYVVRGIESYLFVVAASDEGNSVRLIQIQYFVERISVFGEGFGAEHAFERFDRADRQYAQETAPYGSELPILNVINSAGLIAALWFYLAVKPIFHCLTNIRSRDTKRATQAYFGLACGLVLMGSISNPFFFSPVSMMLICVALDLRNGTKQPA